ncbi:hypothetical protein ITP53_01975 [Nonomuraea sp. K274]|uniref:Uncharacterized protein n=1 Tax=Nonomuraea cypriaca TaxID=1187855 RepID=A0A931A826_9ACTN|nr:hypothetical protein [Nonomuraea cypriaca]MBF8184532.1 hypothetical protein [Nonomuraea cypriaca]
MNYRFPQLVANCHMMLLRLSGRVPDSLIAEARDRLVAEDLEKLAGTVTAAVVEGGIALDERDADLLAGLLTSAGMDPTPLSRVARTAEAPLPAWEFAPVPLPVLRAHGDRIGRCLDLTGDADRALADGLLDERDASLIDWVAPQPGIVGLWRAWRFPRTGSPLAGARRVHLIEVTPGTDPPLLALRAQVVLSRQGELDPRVEVYTGEHPLPAYQRTARAWSSLLWAPTPAHRFRHARLYDTAENGFHVDHPRIGDAEQREKITGYLTSATLIRENTVRRDDIMDPSRRGVVPWNFRTDGTWIWSEAIAYYLREHRLAPAADFLGHLTAAVPRPPAVDTVTWFRARAALYRFTKA